MFAPLALAAAAHLAPTPPLAARPDESLERAKSYLESCETFGWSGVVLIRREGEIVLHRGYGLADRAAGTPCDEDTIFEVASITKPYTAAAVLALARAGELSLEDSVANHLPGVPESRRGITIEHLLAHTSGMPRFAGGGGKTPQDAARQLLGTSPARKPGAGHEYWNGGYALLAALLEVKTGKSYQQAIRELVLDPLDLDTTGFTGEAIWKEGQEAVAYASGAPVRKASGHPYRTYDFHYKGMGGLCTTATELLRFADACISGELLGAEWTKRMLTVEAPAYGLGWNVTESQLSGQRIGHGGDVRGFHGQVQLFPDEDGAIVVLTNLDEASALHMNWTLQRLFFGEPSGYPVPPDLQKLEAKVLERFAGTWRTEDGAALELAVSGRALRAVTSDLSVRSALSGAPFDARAAAFVKRCEDTVLAISKRDPEPLAKWKADRVPESWPGMMVNRIWVQHVTKWGRLVAVRPATYQSTSANAQECVLALEHAKGIAHLKVVETNGRLGLFDLKADAPTSVMLFAPEAPKTRRAPLRFVNFKWSQDPFPVATSSLRFEPAKGTPKTLVVVQPDFTELRLNR